ncbi:cysteine desulfurase family protein [Evansella clarkii]|uniref:cysteine desulfurase family protein n=1 Tax=Evansella clarkii TaxID=79879 RepID=UPI0009988619|nr:cysteine desulfurase family protein [Evansella clarkii]
MKHIYLDHAATSPVHPEVFEAMKPYYETKFGNPSSIHHFGREARRGLDEAREYIAKSIGASFEEIIFTSGGTEADNLAIIGYSMAHKDRGRHLITTKVEHHGVLHAFEYLEKQGFEVTYTDVDENGSVSPEAIERELREDTILVSCMFGNNEVGTIQPVKEIGRVLSEHKAVFHTDAVQAFGIEEIDVNEIQADFLACSAHKVNGPKGIGFLYAKSGLIFNPLLYGGEQERKRRAGTENVAAAAGFKKAVEIALGERQDRRRIYEGYRKIILETLTQEEIPYEINGDTENYLPHILNLSFPGINVESLLMNLDLEGVAVSSGSACTAGSIDPSHVLTAMCEDESRSHSAIRFSFGYGLSEEDVKTAALKTAQVVKRLMK